MKKSIAIAKPSPSSPSSRSAGSRASSKRIEPGVGRAEAELRLLPPRRDAGVARLDEKRGDRAVELREDDRQLGDAAVRDVALLAVEDVLVAVAAGGRLDSGDVGAGAGLGERDRGEAALLGGEPRQPALLLLLGARTEQRPHGEHRRPDRRSQAGAAPRELLRDQARRHRRDAAAAVLGRDRVRRQPERRRLREQLGRAVLALVPLARDRAQLALGELVRQVSAAPAARARARKQSFLAQDQHPRERMPIARRSLKGAARGPKTVRTRIARRRRRPAAGCR